MDINIDKLETAVRTSKTCSGRLAGHGHLGPFHRAVSGRAQPQPAAVALFTEMTNTLSNTLSDSGFRPEAVLLPLDLEGDHVVMIIRHGTDLLQAS